MEKCGGQEPRSSGNKILPGCVESMKESKKQALLIRSLRFPGEKNGQLFSTADL